MMKRIFDGVQKSPLWLQLQTRYERLGEKDRRALYILSLALFITMIYLFLWQPLQAWRVEQREEFAYQENTYEWVQQSIDSAIHFQKKQKASTGRRDLSAVVSGTSRKAEVTISRVQPDRKGLGVWVEDTAYQKLLSWILVMKNKYQINVQQIKIDGLKEEGRVKAFMHLAN